ncbi:hypothetical protein DW061_02585 [Ruminococcus sp. AF42-9BH]|nr:hypothetical protein DW061_02585 [Ruminococcus sp. AF42-9BH]
MTAHCAAFIICVILKCKAIAIPVFYGTAIMSEDIIIAGREIIDLLLKHDRRTKNTGMRYQKNKKASKNEMEII